jgi:hypothetical protein
MCSRNGGFKAINTVIPTVARSAEWRDLLFIVVEPYDEVPPLRLATLGSGRDDEVGGDR